MGNEIDGKIASKNMSIIKDSKQMRVQIPEFLIEIFDINPEKDKFNWYVKRKRSSRGTVILMAIVNYHNLTLIGLSFGFLIHRQSLPTKEVLYRLQRHIRSFRPYRIIRKNAFIYFSILQFIHTLTAV